MFVDEAFYIDWIRKIGEGQTVWLSLEGGKQPLLIWLALPFHTLGSDPLTALRVVVVVVALIGGLFLFRLARLALSTPASAVVVAMYALSPYLVVHQRLFQYEPLLDTLVLAGLFYSLRFLQDFRRADLLVASVLLIAATWTKTSVFAVMAGLAVAAAVAAGRRFALDRRFYAAVIGLIVVPFVSQVAFWLGPFGPSDVSGVNGAFLVPTEQILDKPYAAAFTNAATVFDYWWLMIGPLPALLMLAGLLLGGWRSRGSAEKGLLLVVAVALLVSFTVVGINFPRHYMWAVGPVLILAIAPLDRLARRGAFRWPVPTRVAAGVAAVACLAFPATQTARFLEEPTSIDLSANASDALLSGWSSFPDLDSIRSEIRSLASTGPVDLWNDGTPGLAGGGILPYFTADQLRLAEADEADLFLMNGTYEGWQDAYGSRLPGDADLVLVKRVRRALPFSGCTPRSCADDTRLPMSLYAHGSFLRERGHSLGS
jgi:hypothetical protein